MDKQESNVIRLVFERSLGASLRVGLHVTCRNMWTMLRSTWLTLLLTVICPPLYFLFAGQLDELMRQWDKDGFLHTEKATKISKTRTVRALVAMLVLLVYVGVSVFAGWMMHHQGFDLWLSATVMVLALMLFMPMDMVIMNLSYSDKPMKECFASIGKGFKQYGNLLGFHCTVSLCAIALVAMFALPFVQLIMMYDSYQSSLAMGDTVVEPSNFVLMAIITSVAGTYFILRVSTACKCMHAVLWGGMEGAKR